MSQLRIALSDLNCHLIITEHSERFERSELIYHY